MEIVGLLVVIAMSLAGLFVLAFVWASKQGQWDDLETPAYRVLIEDKVINKIKGENND